MRFALIGQPNCGKSTLFNQVAGYKAETGNFSGTTVTFIETKVRVMGEIVSLVDLPGTYTLAGTNPAERETFLYLAEKDVDVIINVIDGTRLAQGLELTLELMELEKPVVVALNMMDEARRFGLKIDGPALSECLGIPVLPLIASRGRGVKEVFLTALKSGRGQHSTHRLLFSGDIENRITRLVEQTSPKPSPLNSSSAAIKMIENDSGIMRMYSQKQPELTGIVESIREEIQSLRGQDAVWVLSGERHAHASEISRKFAIQGERRTTWRDRLDDFFLHPVMGYIGLVVVLFVFFQFVYLVGKLLEEPLLAFFDLVNQNVPLLLGGSNLLSDVVIGLIQGISGGIAIVLPYLVPFLLGLGLLEDVGYLPRVAFLMDALMHRLGLHGKAVVPFILGYGCNVPAIMSTRIMEDRRDRLIAAALSTMIPCAARLAVVFGLVAFYLGPTLALAIYIFNLFVIALVARLLALLLPEDSPGLIMEMPVYRIPTAKTLLSKSWFRIREFIVEAWPLLIAGSVALSVFTYLNFTPIINTLLSPLAWLLGLPVEVGTPLIFGILRKELSLVMLHQALGGGELRNILTSTQMVVYSVFVVFYIPCMATLMVIRKELGTKAMVYITLMTVLVATTTGVLARLAASIFFGTGS